MPAIVLDVESDRGDGDAEHDRQRQNCPPACHDKQQEQVSGEKPGENRGGFEIHLRAVTALASGLFEIRIHALAQFVDESIAGGEFQIGLCLLHNRLIVTSEYLIELFALVSDALPEKAGRPRRIAALPIVITRRLVSAAAISTAASTFAAAVAAKAA